MCGMVPFGEECEDPYEVYKLIANNKTMISYPRYFDQNANKYAKQMMEQLLNRIPEARLGGSYAALKAHKWFEKFDWVTLCSYRTNYLTLTSSHHMCRQRINSIRRLISRK